VALTFDAGSDRGFAAAILDTLAREHIAAAFGMTGQWATANPDLVRRMVAEGHLLLNHTQHHRSFTGYSTSTAPLTTAQRTAELRDAERAVAAAGGGSMAPWFRPPYGDSDAGVLRDVGAAGYRWSVMWTVDSLGWEGLSAQAIADRCMDGAVPGAIYLMHVGSDSQDAAALTSLIPRLRAAGYGFVRVDRYASG
jgi:peptidoglycan/xylan/chitin deacetylase (PgdA/CDA1 family)